VKNVKKEKRWKKKVKKGWIGKPEKGKPPDRDSAWHVMDKMMCLFAICTCVVGLHGCCPQWFPLCFSYSQVPFFHLYIFCLFGFQHSQITFVTSCFSPFSHFLVFLELPTSEIRVLWESVRTRKDTQVCKGIERICQNPEAYTSLSQASQALALRPSEFWEPGPQPMRARAVALADMPPWRPWRRGNQNVVQLRCTSFLEL
jgi:hypothetical protein